MGRWTTLTFTTTVVPVSGYLDYEYTLPASLIDFHHITIVASLARGGCVVEMYPTAARNTEPSFSTGSFATSFINPSNIVGDPGEATVPFKLCYSDDDVGNELHLRIYSGGVSKTLTFTIEYELPAYINNSLVLNVRSYGASGDGITDDTLAIQAAITAASASKVNRKVWFPSGVYYTTDDIIVPAGSYISIEGESTKGTYLYQQSGTGNGALRILGSNYILSATKTAGMNDAGVRVSHLSIGSKVGPALALKNAYRPLISDIEIFSAGVTSAAVDIDGCAMAYFTDLRMLGNDEFPAGWATELGGRTIAKNGIIITSRVDVNGRYNDSGEIFLNGLRIDGGMSEDSVIITCPTAAPFSLSAVVLSDSKIAMKPTFSGLDVDNGAVVLTNTWFEATGAITDAVRVRSDLGSSQVRIHNSFASNGRLNFDGDGVNKSTLQVFGGTFRELISSSAVYGELNLLGVHFVVYPSSTAVNWTTGDFTSVIGCLYGVAGSYIPLVGGMTHINSLSLSNPSPSASAILDAASTARGLLPPRMTTTERNLISTPPEGLSIYNSSAKKIETWDGTSWQAHW